MFLLILAIYSLNNLDSIFNPSLNESNLYSGDFSLIQDLSDLSGGMKDDKDTTGGKEIPFWKRLSYSIGYSGGLCYTGEDLRKYVGDMTFDPMVALKINLYWLNSIELSVIYPLDNGRGIEVGMGYGWASIGGDRWVGDDWKISYIAPDIGIIGSKWEYNISLCYLNALWFKNEYYGKGWGWKGVIGYKLNSSIKIVFFIGDSNINHNISTSPYNVSLLFNGLGFSLNYRFNLKGGVR